MNVSNLRWNKVDITLATKCNKCISHKWNKEDVIITLRSYVKITLGSWPRLTLVSYVIKPCRWGQEIT